MVLIATAVTTRRTTKEDIHVHAWPPSYLPTIIIIIVPSLDLVNQVNAHSINNHEDESHPPKSSHLLILYALILVGGFGTRLRPLTVSRVVA
jgi:hypothetical protein